MEDELLNWCIGQQDRDTIFGERVDVGIVGCDGATRCGSVEDDVLRASLLGDVVLQTEESLFCVQFVSV
jgi:hypothetical protein